MGLTVGWMFIVMMAKDFKVGVVYCPNVIDRKKNYMCSAENI